jgi:uncharacterized protein
MKMQKSIIKELKTLKDIIVKTIPVGKIYLFGSYADGKADADSDLDIYIVMSDKAEINEIDAMKLIRKAIRDKKTMPVDILVGKEKKFNRRKSSITIESQIEKNGILIYG